MQLVRSNGLGLMAVLALLIACNFLSPASSGMSSDSVLGDLVVGGSEIRVINRDVVVQGNIIVRDSATLMLTGSEMEVLQYSANEYNIFVRDSATLSLSSSKIFSDFALDIIITNSSKLEMIGSHLDTGGSLTYSGAGFVVRASSLSIGSVSLATGFMISDSTLDKGVVTLNAPGDITNSTIKGQVIVSSTDVRLLNVNVGSLQVTGSGEVRIHQWVQAKVSDMLGLPIDGANVTLKRYPTGEVVEWRWSSNGVATFTPASDTVTASGSIYGGNYTLSADYMGSTVSYPIVLPPFKPNRAPKPVTYGYLELPEMAGYVKKSWDLTINGVERVIYGTGNISLYLQGNIVVENGGKLILRDACKVFIDQSKGRAGIVIESGGTIELREGSSIDSNALMGIYLTGGTILTDGASLNASVGGTGSSRVLLNETTVAGSIRGSFDETNLNKITADSLSIASPSLKLSGVDVAEDANISSQNMSLTDINVKGKLTLSGLSKIEARSLKYGELSIPANTELYRYWHVGVVVTNGNDRPVPGASVNVYYLMNQGAPVTSGETDNAGKVTFDLLGDITSSKGTVFAGNYSIEVSFAKLGTTHNKTVAIAALGDTSMNIRFPEKVIPPFHVSLSARSDPAGDIQPGASFYVRGEVFYNGGPDPVPNAQINVMFLEGGNKVYNVTTDAQGIYSVALPAPVVEGEYTIEVHAYDPATGFTNVTSIKINVRPASIMTYAPWLFIIVIIGIIIVLYAIMRIRHNRMEKLKARSRKLAFDEILLNELKNEMEPQKKGEKEAKKARRGEK